MEKEFKKNWLLLLFICIIASCFVFTACGDDDKNEPEPSPVSDPVEQTIIGKWTVEDYNTGKYTTFDFKSDGTYTMLQPLYDRMDMAAGRYHYNHKTKELSFEHFYQDYDFEEHGDNLDFATYLEVKCNLQDDCIVMVGEDCEEFGLESPVTLKKGEYSGKSPDFKKLLSDMRTYTRLENSYGMTENVTFDFDSNGNVEFRLKFTSQNGYGEIYACGLYSVSGYQLFCDFKTVNKYENNLGCSSTSLWALFTDGLPAIERFYLALDEKGKPIISEQPMQN